MQDRKIISDITRINKKSRKLRLPVYMILFINANYCKLLMCLLIDDLRLAALFL